LNKALLIIDMQKGFYTPKTPRFSTKEVVDNINILAMGFRSLHWPVVVIQHDSTGNGEFEKNASDWQNLETLNLKPDDVYIDKYANDVFYRSRLQEVLQKSGISHLFITGCASDFCVWQYMLPTAGGIEVLSTKNILSIL
jgi:nicotinamidase-related amidase